MLLHLDVSAVADATSHSPSAARSRACIENLLLAHFEGNHVISLLPGEAAALRAASPGWSDRAWRALDHVDESYAQIAGLREEICWSLELGLGPGFDGAAHDAAGSTKIIRAHLHDFEKFHTAACSALLGENGADAELFRELGLMRRAVRRWEGGRDDPRSTWHRRLDLRARVQAGGGSRTNRARHLGQR